MESRVLREDEFDGRSQEAWDKHLNSASQPEEVREENKDINFESTIPTGCQRTKVISPKNIVDEMFTQRLRYYAKEIANFRAAYPELKFPEIDALLQQYPEKKGENNVSI